MRRHLLLLGLTVLFCGLGWAQQERAPALQEGPMTPPPAKGQMQPAAPISAASQPASQDAPAVPDADGVYRRGAGLILPKFVEVAPIGYPADAPAAEPPRNCVLSVTVSAEGIPSQIKVLRSLNPAADRAIMEALSKSMFEPGTLDGKPVPMEVEVALHFFSDTGSAVPHVRWSGSMGAAYRTRKWDKPPVAIHSVEAQYSDKARRAKVQGVVLLTFVVDEQGRPTNIAVKKGLGMGLDEKSVEALRQYRFEPAIKDGKPIAAELAIEMSFRLY